MSKRTTTPSYKRRTGSDRTRINKQAAHESVGEDTQFEGLHIHCLGKDTLSKRLGTTSAVTRTKESTRKDSKVATIVSETNSMINGALHVLPNLGIKPVSIINQGKGLINLPLVKPEVSFGLAQYETKLILQQQPTQNQKTLFPYRKVTRGQAVEAKKTQSSAVPPISQSEPLRTNDNTPLTAAYIYNRPGGISQASEQVPYQPKQKKALKPKNQARKHVNAPSSAYPTGYPQNKPKTNNLISVGHNISSVWNYHTASINTIPQYTQNQAAIQQQYDYLQQQLIPVSQYYAQNGQGNQVLPNSKAFIKTQPRNPKVDSDLRLLQTLLKSGCLQPTYIIPQPNKHTNQFSMAFPIAGPIPNPVLTISRKPQFLKGGVAKSSCLASPGSVPSQVFNSQLIEGKGEKEELLEEAEIRESSSTDNIPLINPALANCKPKEDKLAKAAELEKYMQILSSNKYKVFLARY